MIATVGAAAPVPAAGGYLAVGAATVVALARSRCATAVVVVAVG